MDVVWGMAALLTWSAFLQTVAFAQENALDGPPFEAAFQGRCGRGSPCDQLCYELHDGMFECDCKDGFFLHENGYSCFELNTTAVPPAIDVPALHSEQDILYQKDASFSAELETDSPEHQNAFSAVALKETNDAAESTTRGAAPSEPPPLSCSLECGPGGLCTVAGGTPTCLCPLGRGGTNCQQDVSVRSPRFTGQGWLAFPALHAAYKHVQLEMEFRPEAWDGVLFLTGERDDMAGDFMALLLHKGFVEFRFDCGSGVGVVRSEATVVLNEWNHLTLYRHRWEAWLQLNKGKHVLGRSKGLFSRITFREPVFIGGPGNTTGLSEKLPVVSGLRGCVRHIDINDHTYGFQPTPDGDAVNGFNVVECTSDRCSKVPCQHSGKCLMSGHRAVCLCPLGFTGDLCEIRVDLQVPSFNGSSFLRYPGLGSTVLSWLDIELTLKPQMLDGLILYNGHRSDGMGDFMAIYMHQAHLEFAFDLGTGSATIRSEEPVPLDQWVDLRVSRTGRLAVLQVNGQQATHALAPGAFTQLSLPQNLYIGGVPNFEFVSPKVKVRTSFVGCIQKVVINEKPVQILASALAGVNVANCQHPCVATPCGKSRQCVPDHEHYSCQCPEFETCIEPSAPPAFMGDGFALFNDSNVSRRLSSSQMNITLRIRTKAKDGTLLWSGNVPTTDIDSDNAPADFLSLTIVNGALVYRFNLGGGSALLTWADAAISDGAWHRVEVRRVGQWGQIRVDDAAPVSQTAPGSLTQLNTNSGLYIGGVDLKRVNPAMKYPSGLVGCVTDVVLGGELQLSTQMATEQENVHLCE